MWQLLSGSMALFALAGVLSLAITGLAILAARRLRILAHPVERSSHTIPTPQVGGVGICLSFLSVLFLAWRISFAQGAETAVAAIAAMILLGLALGLADDIFHFNALKKLAGLFFLAAIPVLWGGAGEGIRLPGVPDAAQSLLRTALLFAWILFFINAFNFMDGADGQSGFFAGNAFFWWFLFLVVLGRLDHRAEWETVFHPVKFIAAGSVLGFLFWNFPKAKTFMGDSGSLPLGALLATLPFWERPIAFQEWIAYLFPLSFFIYDVVYTLIRRALRGENLLLAHRSHLYQRLLIATGWSHARLLAFHLPFYLLSSLAGLIYFHEYWRSALIESPEISPPFVCTPIQALCIAGISVLLGVYTWMVLRREKQKKRETDP